jgi:hypothetical protein
MANSKDKGIVRGPILDKEILINQNIDSDGNSGAIYIGASKQIDVLINVGTMGMSGDRISFLLSVIEPRSGKTVRSYASQEIIASNESAWITVSDGLTLGSHVIVSWNITGTTHSFTSCNCKIVGKE